MTAKDQRNTRKGGKYSTGEYSVTTILGIIDKPALTVWLQKQIFNAVIDGATDFSEARKVARNISKKAMEIGTRVHSYVEFYGTDVVAPKYDEDMLYYKAYHQWLLDYEPKTVENETTVTSKKYGYKGTLDKIVEIDGKTVLVDLKTGKYIYETVELQASAYKMAWEEERPGKKIDEIYVLLLEKGDDGLPTGTYKYEKLNYLPEIFLAAFEVFKWKKNRK